MIMQTATETSYELEPDIAASPDNPLPEPDSSSDLADTDEDLTPEASNDEPIQDEGQQAGDVQHIPSQMESRLTDQQRELDEYRRLFQDLRSDAEQRLRQADEEAFLNDVRESYQKDPVAAFRMMLDKTQHEMWLAVRDQVKSELRREADLGNMLRQILDDPQNSIVKPYREEMERLVSQHGFEPQEAAVFLRTLAKKAQTASRNKASAVQRIRARSSVESGGEPSQAADPDRQFYRIIKKAKTLDDMFEGLRRAGSRATPA